MDITLRLNRQIDVEDMGDAVDIDAAGGDIGGDQQFDAAALQIAKGALTGILRFVAMDDGGLEAILLQVFGHTIGAMLGTGEEQRALHRLGAQDMRQQRTLVVLGDVIELLLDAFGGRGNRRHFDALGIGQQAIGQIADLARHGGRE